MLLIGLIFGGHTAYAATAPPAPININIDLSGVINAINNSASSANSTQNTNTDLLKNTMNGLSLDFFGLFTNSGKAAVRGFNTTLLGLTANLLSANPDPESMYKLWQSITLIISSFYLIIFMIVGLKFLTSGHSVEGREKAKGWLKNAFMMIIGVNVSFYLYKLILELSTAITKYIWITGFENFFTDSILTGAGFVMLIFSAATIGLALITLFLRYAFLLIAVLLFPIGIFLYYTPNLQNWGKIIFNLIGIALFMQFIDVIIFLASNQIITAFTGEPGQAFIPALAFALVAIINILMTVYAVLKSAFSIADNAPILSYAFGALSGQIGMLVNSLKPAPKPAPLEGNTVQ